jgi:menaquinone-dependent protoporphyrinogen IX oxidase
MVRDAWYGVCSVNFTRVVCENQIQGNGNIYICAYYRKNVTDEESIRNFETSVTRASAINNAILIIGGDMNFPGWNWKENTLVSFVV